VVSDERLVMALLAEGNPATEIAEDASTGVPAATYLATLEQSSSDMTQLETKQNEPERKRPWTTPWLVAAIAVIVLGVAAIAVNQTRVPAIPLSGAEGDPQAAEEFRAVEADFNAFNTGDPAWFDIRLRGSFETQGEREALLAEVVASWQKELAANPRIDVSGCASQGHGEWPNLGDEGIPAPTGYYFICETTMTDALYDIGGVSVAETYFFVVDNGAVVAVLSQGKKAEADQFLADFHNWMWATHPDVAADLVPTYTTAESVPTVLEYAEEFVTQSDKYPIASAS